MKIGKAHVDFDKFFIRGPAGESKIEPKIMEVLQALVNRCGEVVSREELIDEVWGIGYGGDERLSRAISLLRKAFGDSLEASDYIRTVSRKGYKLTAKISGATDQRSLQTIGIPKNIDSIRPQSYFKTLIHHPKSLLAVLAIVFAAILLVSSSLAPLESSKSARVSEGLDKIINFTRPGAIEDAQQTFSTILSDNPDHAAARAGLALALIREYLQFERDPALLNRARSAAQLAYEEDKNLALANIAMAWAAGTSGDFSRAHMFYDRADILDPDNRLTLEGRIRDYLNQNKNQIAQKSLDRAISLYPDYPMFYTFQAAIFLRENEYQSAEAMFRTVIALSEGTDSRAYAQLAHTLHHQDKTQAAIRVLQDGLEDNETATLYNNLGTYLFFQGQYEMSADAFERTLDYAGDTHEYLYWANLADAYRFIPNKSKEANAAYDRAIQLLSDKIETVSSSVVRSSRLALYNAKRGHERAAKDNLAKISESADLTAADYFRLSLIYEILSDRDTALDYLEKALKAGYTHKEIMNDPELAELRQDKNYHLLIADME